MDIQKIEGFVHSYRMADIMSSLNDQQDRLAGMWVSERHGVGNLTIKDKVSGSPVKHSTVQMTHFTLLVHQNETKDVLNKLKTIIVEPQQGEFLFLTPVEQIVLGA